MIGRREYRGFRLFGAMEPAMARQTCPPCSRAIATGENVTHRERTPRHLRCTDAGERPARDGRGARRAMHLC